MSCLCACFNDAPERIPRMRSHTSKNVTDKNDIKTPLEEIDKQHTYNMTELVDLSATRTAKAFDHDYIFNFIHGQINAAQCYDDLHHLISLLPIKTLKEILLNQLIKIKEKLKTKQTVNDSETNRSVLHRIYLQSASLEEIFCDDILVNIVRFLPSNHYSQLPLISRNFSNIMKTYPSVYNRYTINIALNADLLNNDGTLWVIVNHNLQSIRILHKTKESKTTLFRNDSTSVRRLYEEEAILNDPNTIKYAIKNLNDIVEKVPFLWHCCKQWNIENLLKIKAANMLRGNSSASASSIISYKLTQNISAFSAIDELKTNVVVTDVMQKQNDKNNLFVAIVNKSQSYIQSLHLDNVNDKESQKWIFLKELSVYKALNHIHINQAIHSSILESWMNAKQCLLAIQCLQFTDLININAQQLKQLVEACSNLLVFDCYFVEKVSDDFVCIRLPQKIEFVRLQFVSECVQIDLSQCTNICALYLNDKLADSQPNPLLDTISSGTADSMNYDEMDDSKQSTKKVYEHIIWPSIDAKIQCLFLEQAMDDTHNMNIGVPTFINEWYETLHTNKDNANSLIPIRCVRYLTNPFVLRQPQKEKNNGTTELNEDDVPEPPMLLNTVPLRMSASPQTSHKYEDYGDPFKFDQDKMDMIDLTELKKMAFGNNENKLKILRVLYDERDEMYNGYLWKLLLKLKHKDNDNVFEEQCAIYENWFDIGVASWIRKLGACKKKLPPKLLNAYSSTSRPQMMFQTSASPRW